MFYERHIANEYIQLLDKQHYSFYLITGAFENYRMLTQDELIVLTFKWKKKVKEALHLDDVGVVLNGGNVFVGIQKNRTSSFLSIISEISFTKANKSSIYSDVLELSENEIGMMIS